MSAARPDPTIHVLVATTPERSLGLAQARDRMPRWRRDKHDRLRREADRQECIVAWTLAEAGWRMLTKMALPETNVGPNGRPGFTSDVTGDFSLSHRDGWCAAATATSAVGIDIHTRIPFDEDLLQEWAGPEAPAWRGPLRAIDDLAPLWTQLEAEGKSTGVGLRLPRMRRGGAPRRLPPSATWRLPQSAVTLSVATAAASAQELVSRVRLWWVEAADALIAAEAPGPIPLYAEVMITPTTTSEDHVSTH